MSFEPPAFTDELGKMRVYRCWHCARDTTYTLRELFQHLSFVHHAPFPGQPYEIDEQP